MHYVEVPATALFYGSRLSRLTILQLYRRGFDTLQIAAAKGVSEARIYNLLHAAKEKERQQIAEAMSIGRTREAERT